MNPTRQRIIGYLNFIADIFDTSAEQRTEKIEKYAGDFKIANALGDLIFSYSHGIN